MSHIVHLIPTLDRLGGAERQLLLLAQGLQRRGWRVDVVALVGDGGDPAAELREAGVGLYSLHMRHSLFDPIGWQRWRSWLRSEQPDLVHAHLPHASWLARWSRGIAPVRVLVETLHTSALGPLSRQLGYRLSRWAPDCTIAVSHAVADAYAAAGLVNQHCLSIVPNGVDCAEWKPDPAARAASRAELHLKDEFLWLAAGRLDPVKDFSTLLRAFSALPESARLVIAGSGPEDAALRQLATQLGIEQRVIFLGFVTHLQRWMQAADGFVLSSLWEGLPMTLIEAAACALPAVATRVAGSSEVIAENETGFLCPSANAPALREAMIRLMQLGSVEHRSMREQARLRALQCFSIDAVLDRWEELYLDLLKRKPQPSRWGLE